MYEVEDVKERLAVFEAEQRLTEQYGAARDTIGPGLNWLFGNSWKLVYPWLDHPEYRIKDGRRTLIGRPYRNGERDGISEKWHSEIEMVARKEHVDVHIHPYSTWNTGTITIAFTERTPTQWQLRKARKAIREATTHVESVGQEAMRGWLGVAPSHIQAALELGNVEEAVAILDELERQRFVWDNGHGIAPHGKRYYMREKKEW